MYQYDTFDEQLVQERVTDFREQTNRYLAGQLDEEAFKPLRLMNGLYIQRHAPMLRVAIPYGVLSSRQLRMLASIATRYDRGYGHFTTRQNVQFNWPALERVPDILEDLASVDMHAIQTSGNCIRNITCDHLAGVAADEVADPRPWCELLRQWSTLHPEFSYLPRKFKIAVTGARRDRAVTEVHDIGLRLVENDGGELGFEVLVGGGLGRTPIIGKVLNEFLPHADLLSYLQAIIRVYNLEGRRDNKYKARIKILVNALGIDEFRRRVDAEWDVTRRHVVPLDPQEVDAVRSHFAPPSYRRSFDDESFEDARSKHGAFARWVRFNTAQHRQPGHRVVFVSLKAPDVPPGDITATQMLGLAGLADRYSFGLVRTSHDQNLLLADVAVDELHALWQQLDALDLATPNIGTLTDMICCPGLEFCSLANAESISIAGRSTNASTIWTTCTTSRRPHQDLRVHERLRPHHVGHIASSASTRRERSGTRSPSADQPKVVSVSAQTRSGSTQGRTSRGPSPTFWTSHRSPARRRAVPRHGGADRRQAIPATGLCRGRP